MNTMPHAATRNLSMVTGTQPPRRSSTRRESTRRTTASPTGDIASPSPEVATPPSGRILAEGQFVDGSIIEGDETHVPQRSGRQDSQTTAVEKEKSITSIVPFAPIDTGRYDKRSKERLITHTHQAIRSSVMIRTMKQVPTISNGWRRYVHSEGIPYYYHPTKEVPAITENDLSNAAMLELIEEGYETVMDTLEQSEISLGGLLDPELCLYIRPDDLETVYYYFVDHDSQCVFWLDDEVNSEDVGLYRFLDEEHLKLQLRTQYFRHIEAFPRSTLSPAVEEELLQLITWNSIDYLTCPTSTSPYDKSTLDDFANIVKTCPRESKTFVVGRLMALLLNHQFFNCHGLPVARLERTMKIEDLPTHPVGWPMKLMFIFLLNSPRTHLKKLNELRVDEVLYKLQWPKFLEGLIRDWSEISVLASIVLASNMGFLAISSYSVSSTVSLVSTVLALGSMIVSLVNGRQQRGRMDAGAEDGGLFLERVHHPKFGLQPLAVYLALPYTMMLWSVISFAGAIVLFCFRPVDNNPGGGGTNIPDMSFVTTAIMTAVSVIVGLVVLITVVFVWLDDRWWMEKSRTGMRQWWDELWSWLTESRVARAVRNSPKQSGAWFKALWKRKEPESDAETGNQSPEKTDGI